MKKVRQAKAIGGTRKTGLYCLYELEIWYDDMDLNKRGCHDYVPHDKLLQLAGGIKGWGFKKVNDYLKTEDGIKWLESHLNKE